MTPLQEPIYTDDGGVWVVVPSGTSHAVHAHIRKIRKILTKLSLLIS
jgi:hypothetical protein